MAENEVLKNALKLEVYNLIQEIIYRIDKNIPPGSLDYKKACDLIKLEFLLAMEGHGVYPENFNVKDKAFKSWDNNLVSISIEYITLGYTLDIDIKLSALKKSFRRKLEEVMANNNFEGINGFNDIEKLIESTKRGIDD